MTRVYSNLKFIRFPDRLDAIRDRRLVAPVHVRIKPMNRCNHDCWYCAYRMSNLKLGEDMDVNESIPEAKMMEIADDLVAMGVEAVTFSGGGEPTIYKPLPRVIERLAEGGLAIGCLTNGSALTGRIADAFAQHGTWVRISLEGWDDESYAKARGIKAGAFTRLLENMTAFAARGSQCTLGVSIIVDENNYCHLAELVATLKQTGIRHVKITGVVVSNDGAENNAYHQKLQPRVFEEIEAAQAQATDDFMVVNHYHDLPERFRREYHLCPNIQFNPVIGGDCMVYTCHDKAFTKEGMLGSVREQRFRDMWYSEETRQRIYSIDPARDCPHQCADHIKNLSMLEALSIDPQHGRFV